MNSFLDLIVGFLKKYFVDPVVYRTGAYNPVNTTVYALIAFFALYKTYFYLRGKVKFGVSFAADLLPFIVLGSSLRVIDDAGLVRTWLFVTPSIYLIIYGFWITSFHFAAFKLRNLKLHMLIGWSAALPALIILFFNPVANQILLLYVSVYLATFTFSAFLVEKGFKKNFFNGLGWLAVGAQGLDGLVTFLGVSLFGYTEEHVLPRFMFGFMPEWLFFVIKLVASFLVVYLLCKVEDQGGFWVSAVYVLGLATGLRDTFRMLLGV